MTVDGLRILLVGEGWPAERPGGLNRYLADLHCGLRSGCSLRTLVVGKVEGDSGGVLAVAPAEAPLLRRLVAFARQGLGEYRYDRPDVVDVHFALYGFPVVLLTPLRRSPLLVHFHGPWAAESETESRRTPGSRAKFRVERAVYRRADAVVTLSEAFRRLVISDYGVPAERVHVIAPGVDLERFTVRDRAHARAELGLPAEGRVVVCVRRLVRRVGVDLLVEAWAQTDRRGILLVVGDGPERPALEEQARRLGITGSVRFTGAVSEATLPTVYAAADLSVVPSRSLEGFGLVVLESLASGTPVLVTDVGGLAEVVQPLSEELVVPGEDPDALAGRLAELAGGRVVPPSAADCRRFAETFTWDRAVAQHLVLVDQLAAGSRLSRVRVS